MGCSNVEASSEPVDERLCDSVHRVISAERAPLGASRGAG